QHAGEVLAKRVQPAVLDGHDLLVDRALLAAADGLADMDPVGGLVASATVTYRLDEGFEQHRAIAVALMPMVGQLAGDQRQDLRGEPFGLDPGQDQEAGVVDDELKVLERLRFWAAGEA